MTFAIRYQAYAYGSVINAGSTQPCPISLIEIGLASKEHYSPLGPTDIVPSSPVSTAVALADKIDTLTGFWIIDEKPTGSKDPFALRRAALGVIRLLVIENNDFVQFSSQMPH